MRNGNGITYKVVFGLAVTVIFALLGAWGIERMAVDKDHEKRIGKVESNVEKNYAVIIEKLEGIVEKIDAK